MSIKRTRLKVRRALNVLWDERVDVLSSDLCWEDEVKVAKLLLLAHECVERHAARWLH